MARKNNLITHQHIIVQHHKDAEISFEELNRLQDCATGTLISKFPTWRKPLAQL